jgi:hypothetical protein
MRRFFALCLISIMPLSLAFATDSDYHQVHYGDAAPASQSNTMNYWDDGKYATNMLGPNLLMDNHQSRLDYSAPQPGSMLQTAPDYSAPSGSADIPHSRPAADSVPDNSANNVQP